MRDFNPHDSESVFDVQPQIGWWLWVGEIHALVDSIKFNITGWFNLKLTKRNKEVISSGIIKQKQHSHPSRNHYDFGLWDA